MKLEKIQIRLYGGGTSEGPSQGPDRLLKAVAIAVRRDGDVWYRVGKPTAIEWKNVTDRDVEIRSIRIEAPRAVRAITDEIFLKGGDMPRVIKARIKDEKTGKYKYNTVTSDIPERVLEITR